MKHEENYETSNISCTKYETNEKSFTYKMRGKTSQSTVSEEPNLPKIESAHNFESGKELGKYEDL